LGTGFYGSNDPTNSVKALKEEHDDIAHTHSPVIWSHTYYYMYLVVNFI